MSALPFQPNHPDVLTAAFYLHRQQTGHKVHLLTGNEARAMVKLCLDEAKSPLAVLKFLWGFTESHALGRIALMARDANVLLQEYEKFISDTEFSGVLHVIVSNVIDRWNLISHSLIYRYHYDGPGIAPPANLSALVKRIASKQGISWQFSQVGFYGDGVLDTCVVCTESVNIKNTTCICLLCKHVFHFACVQKWIKARDSSLPCQCPLCRQEFATHHSQLDLTKNPKFTVFRFQSSAPSDFS